MRCSGYYYSFRVCPHQASAAASPLEYIVTLGNQFSSVTMYSNGDAAADPRCGQTFRKMGTSMLFYFQKAELSQKYRFLKYTGE